MTDDIKKTTELDESAKYRERWLTPEGKATAEKIIDKLIHQKPFNDWIGYLEGIPFVDELDVRHDEPFSRDLRGFDFTRLDLTRAIFTHCHLDFANFKHTILDHAQMRGVEMKHAFLKRASLQNTHLWNANLEYSVMAYADLTAVDLGDANLQHADFWWARMDEANLRGADLSHANMQWARLPQADLWGATINDVKFEGTSLLDVKVNEDTKFGLHEMDIGDPFSQTIRHVWRSIFTGSVKKVGVAVKDFIASIGRSVHLMYWGKPTPIMYFEVNAKTTEDYKIARDVYRQLYSACKDGGLGDEASWFFYRSMVCRRQYVYQDNTAGSLLDYVIFDCLSGYGERPRWVIGTMFNVVLLFGLLNWVGGSYGGLTYNGKPFYDIGFLGSLYFSIESFTTVGYGDIAPNHYSTIGQVLRFFDAVESLIGNLLMALALVCYTRIAIRD